MQAKISLALNYQSKYLRQLINYFRILIFKIELSFLLNLKHIKHSDLKIF